MPAGNTTTNRSTQSKQMKSLRMIQVSEASAPAAPSSLADTGIDPEALADLALRFAYTAPRFTTQAAADRLALPFPLVAALLEELRSDKLLEVLGESGPMD